MLKLPGVRELGCRGEMTGALGQLGRVGQQCSSSASGDQLVAVEAQGAHAAEQAAMGSIAPTCQRLGSILDEGQPPCFRDGA